MQLASTIFIEFAIPLDTITQDESLLQTEHVFSSPFYQNKCAVVKRLSRDP